MFQVRPMVVGSGAGVDMGVGAGLGVAVGIGAGLGVAVGIGSNVGMGGGVEVGSEVPRSSSIVLEMSSKEGEPSYLTPVVVGSLERMKIVGVTETWFCSARLMSLWTTPSYLRVSRQEAN